MRVFIGARPVTSLEFPRAETRHFKWQVRKRGGKGERFQYTTSDLQRKSLYLFCKDTILHIFIYLLRELGKLEKA